MRKNGKGRKDNIDIKSIRSLMRVTSRDRFKSEERAKTYNKLKNFTAQAMYV